MFCKLLAGHDTISFLKNVFWANRVTMRISKHKWFWVTGAIAFLAFLLLFMIRLDLFNKFLYRPKVLEISTVNLPNAKETWMNIFQGNRKIGFSHTRLTAENDGRQRRSRRLDIRRKWRRRNIRWRPPAAIGGNASYLRLGNATL